MSTLKFEIDTEDVFGPYGDPEDFTPIEELIKSGLASAVKEKLQKNFSHDRFNTIVKNINLECVWQIEKKLNSLVDEDIAMTDRWGHATFVGSVEDYIKKQIDEKMLHPVDSYGKTLSGSCSTKEETWIEWHVKKKIDSKLKSIDSQLDSIAKYHCKEAIDNKIANFKSMGLNKLIMDRLEVAGVK